MSRDTQTALFVGVHAIAFGALLVAAPSLALVLAAIVGAIYGVAWIIKNERERRDWQRYRQEQGWE